MEWHWNKYGARMPEVDSGAVVDPDAVQGYGQTQNGGIDRVNVRMELQRLESRLADIDAKLAAFDKENPGFDKEAAKIAAKRAEIGDFSAYDNMVGRQGSQNADPTGIENELYNAEKLTWGLKSKSGEEKEIAKANIEASLRRAEEWADKTGGKLPMSYYRLKSAIEGMGATTGDDDRSELEWSNRIYTKALNKQLTDADIKEMTDYIENHPDRELSKALQAIVAGYKGKTNESKAKANAEKATARSLYESIVNLPIDDQFKAFRSWSDEKKKAFWKYYKIDEKKGAEAR